MAVKFVVETGSGTPGSGTTSYLTVEEADDIVALDFMRQHLWDALEVGEKEIRLMYGTRLLDRTIQWRGTKTNREQPLDWPRTDARDAERQIVGSMVIPTEVKEAVVEIVLHALSSPVAGTDPVGVKRFKADTFEIEFAENSIMLPEARSLALLLNGLGSALASVGAKPIRRV